MLGLAYDASAERLLTLASFAFAQHHPYECKKRGKKSGGTEGRQLRQFVLKEVGEVINNAVRCRQCNQSVDNKLHLKFLFLT